MLCATRVLPCAMMLVAKSSRIRIATLDRDSRRKRIGAKAGVAAAPWGDDRAGDDVDEMNGDEPFRDRHLGPGSDAPEVMRVA